MMTSPAHGRRRSPFFVKYCTVGTPTGIVPAIVYGPWQLQSIGNLQPGTLPSRVEGAALWFAQLSDFRDGLSSIADIALSPDELDRAQRMSAEPVRIAYLTSCVLLRRILSAYLGVSPSDIALVRGEHGKPVLAHPERSPHLHFNLSHGGDAWLCGVSSTREIGVDVETRRQVPSADRLATRVLSSAERAALSDLESTGDAMRDAAFLRCWTRKEAVLKATGSGFSWAARDIEVGIDTDFRCTPLPQKPGWEAGVWSLDLPAPGFAAAAVIGSGSFVQPVWTAARLTP
jgi:4'-phosphopantetheinyl transferase